MVEEEEGETAKKDLIKAVNKFVKVEGFESAKALYTVLKYAEKCGKHISNNFKEEVKKSTLPEETKIDYLKTIPKSQPKIYYESSEGAESIVDKWDRFNYEAATRKKGKEVIKKIGTMGGKQQ